MRDQQEPGQNKGPKAMTTQKDGGTMELQLRDKHVQLALTRQHEVTFKFHNGDDASDFYDMMNKVFGEGQTLTVMGRRIPEGK